MSNYSLKEGDEGKIRIVNLEAVEYWNPNQLGEGERHEYYKQHDTTIINIDEFFWKHRQHNLATNNIYANQVLDDLEKLFKPFMFPLEEE